MTHLFPSAATIAGLSPEQFAMPRARGRALIHACERIAAGDLTLDMGSDRDATVAALQALPGIGPWTAGYVAMRALGDPDVFLPTDGADGSPAAAAAAADRWRPWRTYALHHLWATL
ncbi:MAG: hypothetical protein R2694_09215 [Ilumatobacteraceae bacterium]